MCGNVFNPRWCSWICPYKRDHVLCHKNQLKWLTDGSLSSRAVSLKTKLDGQRKTAKMEHSILEFCALENVGE